MKKANGPLSPNDRVILGLIQTCAHIDPEENLRLTLSKIKEAADHGAQIICLQELFKMIYFPQIENAKQFRFAETIPGPTTLELGKIAREKNVVIIGSVFEKRVQGMYHNTAVVIGPDGEIIGTYRKMHIPDDPGFFEKYYFTPGDLGFLSFQTPFAKIGVLICWDQWFPEAARLTALKGAQILFYPTAIGSPKGEKSDVIKAQAQAWETIQRAHAIANGVFVAAVNRVGEEDDLRFWGSSFVCDPFGEVVARAHDHKEETLIVPCDLKKIEETRQAWPFLRDRRIDSYQGLTSRFIDKEDISNIKN